MLSQMLKPLEHVKDHLILALIYQNCGEMTSDNIDLRAYHDMISSTNSGREALHTLQSLAR
jgi:hypothetical protein